MFDTGVIGEIFMDKKYAQQQRFPPIFLIRFIPLQGFDGNVTGSAPMIHFVYIFLVPPGHKPQFTRLFLIDILQFPIMINLPWMRSKFTTIRLRPDVPTIDFQNLDKINESVNTPETMEINSLTKSGNYQFPSVEKIPDEREPEEFQPFMKRKLLGQRSQGKKKARILKRGEKFPQLFDDELVKKELPEIETPLKIKMITAAPFFHVSKQKGVELFSVSLKDVEKALRPKQHTDPATKLPPELHEFFELFFHQKTNKLPPHKPYDHKIKFIKSKQPGYGLLYSMSQRELQILKKIIDENLTKGFIKTNSFPTAIPVLFAKKPGKSFRLCVNYKTFNAITVKNKYPLPLIQETLNRLAKVKYFTKLNIVVVFNKIRIIEGEKWKTVFRTKYNLFESLIMNFGLCGAPSSFQNYINDIFHEYLNTFCSAYIDNIFISNKTKKKHMKHVQQIFQKLQKAGFQFDIDKYEFFVKEIKYLNLIITPENIKMDQKKFSTVFDWSIPENLKNIQSFLNFANFYRRFIRDFSKLTAPLNALAKKDILFHWGPEQQKVFDNLKIAFTTAFILLHYDPNKQTVIKTNVSNYVTAGILFQYDDNGQLKPVVYFFCKMSPAEYNYEIYDKKFLAIIKIFEL